jgi:SNF2 family DNA or RNA helicase
LAPGPPAADVEDFGAALASVQLTAEDYERARDAEADMRELLAGAIGDGEDAAGGIKEGEDVVEGFAKGVTLMPHQVRGTQWMASRESGRKYGGILADVSKDTSGIWSEPCALTLVRPFCQDMGLGKTVQMLTRIVQGRATAAERKAGYKGGTL